LTDVADTRHRILEVARELFNAEGISRVGVRDIARALDISAGNLGYHFPTRDDLVAALVLELNEENQRTIFAALPEDFSLETLYRSATAAMRNMLRYRFILVSYVEAVRASPELARLEGRLSVERRRRHDEMVAALVDGGYVKQVPLGRRDRLYEQGVMISSGWLVIGTLRGLSDEAAVRHFAKLGCALLEPHCTPKGARQMRRLLAGDYDRRP
jgi:AcrR family transcriptional regulator